jgi:hypothetical protein
MQIASDVSLSPAWPHIARGLVPKIARHAHTQQDSRPAGPQQLGLG